MNKLKYLLLVAMLPLCFSCKDFLDINTDKDSSSSTVPEQLLPVVVFYAAQQNFDHAEYGVYLSQCLTTGGRSQTGAYAYKSGWDFPSMNRHPQWRRHYFDLGANIEILIDLSRQTNSPNYELIARSIRLASTLFTTDAFGEMPLSEVYKSVSPKYDSQEEIYDWMYKEADELLAMYNDPSKTKCPTNKIIDVTQDRVFAGDLEKWKHYTLGIKARLLLRKLPNWENTVANCDKIISTVDEALSAGWQEPRFNYDGGSGEKNCPWGSARPTVNGWESRSNLLHEAIPSKFFMVDMLGIYDGEGGREKYDEKVIGFSEDPRMARLMVPRKGPDGDAQVKFRYLQNNIGMGTSYKATHYPDLYCETNKVNSNPYTQNMGYVTLITEEELLLIKAEALWWKGDKMGALEAMKSATLKNMERFGVAHSIEGRKDGGVQTYHTEQYIKMYLGEWVREDDQTTTIKKNLDKREARFKAMQGKYFPLNANELTIGQIMRQKYVCMYLQPEQWTDMRRYRYSNMTNQIKYEGFTIYPALQRPYNLYAPYWMPEIKGEGQQWVQRYNADPETEEKYNKPELERLGAYKNPDWLKKPLIWAVKR